MEIWNEKDWKSEQEIQNKRALKCLVNEIPSIEGL